MPLQTQDLTMAGLGLEKDAPPNALQPPLVPGVHLRWAFPPARGFPWYGFYLFRRPSVRGELVCLALAGRDLRPGPLAAPTLSLPSGQIESDRPLVLTDDFPPPRGDGVVEFDLEARGYLRFILPPGAPALRAEASVGFRRDAKILVTGYSLGVPFTEVQVEGINYFADTLLFGGVILSLARAYSAKKALT